MSNATNFLARWISSAQTLSPSVTVVTCQATADQRPGGQHWLPARVSYSFGINGSIVRDGSGAGIGLRFNSLVSTYSDRIVNPNASGPTQQRFDPASVDRMSLVLTQNGDSVKAEVTSITWGFNWAQNTTMTDPEATQLMFLSVPPVGNVPVNAVMLISFQQSGNFGWL